MYRLHLLPRRQRVVAFQFDMLTGNHKIQCGNYYFRNITIIINNFKTRATWCIYTMPIFLESQFSEETRVSKL